VFFRHFTRTYKRTSTSRHERTKEQRNEQTQNMTHTHTHTHTSEYTHEYTSVSTCVSPKRSACSRSNTCSTTTTHAPLYRNCKALCKDSKTRRRKTNPERETREETRREATIGNMQPVESEQPDHAGRMHRRNKVSRVR
jgi:hypothetical protein